MTLSDRVVLMDHGDIVQVGSPVDLYERLATTFAAMFVGTANLLDAHVDGATARVDALDGLHVLVAPGTPRGTAHLFVRPENLVLRAAGDGPRARVLRSVYGGNTKLVILAIGEQELRARVPTQVPFAEGDTVTLAIERYHVVPA